MENTALFTTLLVIFGLVLLISLRFVYRLLVAASEADELAQEQWEGLREKSGEEQSK